MNFYIDVGGERFHVGRTGYQATPDAGYFRLFYLPRTHWVVNLEPLPGPAAPAFTPATARTATEAYVAAMRSHNEVRTAEARADMASITDHFNAEMRQAAVPPPAEQRDPRPLSQSLVGSWSNALMTLAFAADNTVAVKMMSGHERQGIGRWALTESCTLTRWVATSQPKPGW